MIYIKTGNMLGFQFAPVPLPPFQSLPYKQEVSEGWKGSGMRLYYYIKQNPCKFSTAPCSATFGCGVGEKKSPKVLNFRTFLYFAS
ncbi:hypothetical protein DXC20_15860 [Bacteroides sp. OM08-17BH]|nr:hypothetical protein DXC20_15860 [Bacteroides sp. OM08-17BH]HBO06939.1 hypothetical protein [Bacteroides sp.]